jgi:hypothetical protein
MSRQIKQPKGAKPTHQLKIRDKATGEVSLVGVAWINEKGWFSIKLNAHVVLSEVQLRDSYLSLYPSDFDVSTRNVRTTVDTEGGAT